MRVPAVLMAASVMFLLLGFSLRGRVVSLQNAHATTVAPP